MILKSCPRCKKLMPYGHTYCEECEPIMQTIIEERKKKYKKKSNQEYNKKRDPKYVRFYRSSDWKILSKKYSQDKGYRCEECGKIATDVHHKKAIQTDEGWDRRFDYSNLELLCVSCHNKRHNRFKKRKGVGVG